MSDSHGYSKELVLLVADLDAENSLRGILHRWQALGIRPLDVQHHFDILRHPQRDPGCRGNAQGFLRGFVRTHHYALVVFDHDGCGWDDREVTEIEADVECRLADTGWGGRCAAVVIAPELEAWVWCDSPHVADELGWRGRIPPLNQWMEEKGLAISKSPKPPDPKTAMRKAMYQARKPLSPRIFSVLAEKVSLDRCKDRAFLKLKDVLRKWFGTPGQTSGGER